MKDGDVKEPCFEFPHSSCPLPTWPPDGLYNFFYCMYPHSHTSDVVLSLFLFDVPFQSLRYRSPTFFLHLYLVLLSSQSQLPHSLLELCIHWFLSTMHSISKLLAGSIVAFAAARSVVAASGGVKFAGVNIAGFDFGCATDVRSSFSLLSRSTTLCNTNRFLHRAPVPSPPSTHP